VTVSMAKTQGRGDSSDDEEETPEDVAEINRIMGRDKPIKLTSEAGMSLAERQQARMKAAAAARKPGHTSSKTASSLTTYVPHNPQNPSHQSSSASSASSHSHHSRSPSHPPQSSSSTTTGSTQNTTNTTGGQHPVNPSMALKNIETIGSLDPHLVSPIMRQMNAHNRNMTTGSTSTKDSPPSQAKALTKAPTKAQKDSPTSQTKGLTKAPAKAVSESTKPPITSPTPLSDHKRALTTSALKTPVPDDDVELDPPELSDEDEEEKKKKKKKGFWGKVKKAVKKKSKDTEKGKGSDSESGDDDEKESKEMQADIDRIMRGKVQRPNSPTSGQGKGLSLQERAALAQKRAAGK